MDTLSLAKSSKICVRGCHYDGRRGDGMPCGGPKE